MNTTISSPAANAGKTSALPQMSRILVPTDFSSLSRLGIQAALSLIHGMPDASVEVVHVIEPGPISGMTDFGVPVQLGLEKCVEQAEEEMDRLGTMMGENKQLHARVITGKVARTLCDMARDGHFDLIVLSSHGRTGLERMLMGSIAERIVNDAPCPVLVIKPLKNEAGRFLHESPSPVWKELVVGYDHRAGAGKALAMAEAIAKHQHSHITLLHALPLPDSRVALNLLVDPDSEAMMVSEALGELGQVGATHMPKSANWQYRVATGHPWDVLTDYARKVFADLIVVGPHEHTRWNLEFMGSTAQRVARLAHCAVLVVK